MTDHQRHLPEGVREKREGACQLTTYFEATAELAQDGYERSRYFGVAGIVAVAALVIALIYFVV